MSPLWHPPPCSRTTTRTSSFLSTKKQQEPCRPRLCATAEPIAEHTSCKTSQNTHIAEHMANHATEHTQLSTFRTCRRTHGASTRAREKHIARSAAEQTAEPMRVRTHTCECIAKQYSAAFVTKPSHQVAPVAFGPSSWAGAVTKARAAKTRAAQKVKVTRAARVTRAAEAAKAARTANATRMEACPLRSCPLR